MPYSGVIFDGSVSSAKIAVCAITCDKIADGAVTCAKIAAGTISGDRLAANLNYSGDMTVQQFCACKCLMPAVTGCSFCCYGGYFSGNCGICVWGMVLGATIYGMAGALCASSTCCFAARICSTCGVALCAMSCCLAAGMFQRCSFFGVCTCNETQCVSIAACGYGLCACYCGYDTLAYAWRCSSAQLACGDYGLYTLSKVYAGGGLVVSGNAGAVEGSISICSGCMCYYSSGMWHPICKTI